MDESKNARMSYIENAGIGTIVAFRTSNGKVKSAKIVKRDMEQKMLELETGYGAKFSVAFSDVVWVRTGKRWPKGVYELLKGISDAE